MLRAARRRRRLSLTSLIDVIFLLLLFFMLTSTFSRYSEIEFSSSAPGETVSDRRPLFLQLRPRDLRLNGDPLDLDSLPRALSDLAEEGVSSPLLVSLSDGVTAQRLTDLLVRLRDVPGVEPTVLGRR